MELGAEAERKGCPIGETGGQLILCSSPAPDAVYLKTVKKSMGLACVRPGDTAGVLERLAPVFPQLCPAANVLETSLNNSNPISTGRWPCSTSPGWRTGRTSCSSGQE